MEVEVHVPELFEQMEWTTEAPPREANMETKSAASWDLEPGKQSSEEH